MKFIILVTSALGILVILGGVLTGLKAWNSNKEIENTIVTDTIDRIEPTLLPTATPTTSPTIIPTKKPIIKPTASPTPKASPTPIPLSDASDVYLRNGIAYKDHKKMPEGMSQAFLSGTKTTVVDYIEYMGFSFANGGGVWAKNVDAKITIDGKVVKQSTTADLGPGASDRVYYYDGFPLEAGVTHKVRVSLNDSRTFVEANYDNNVIEFEYIKE